jgi:hypothetical protein
MIEYTRPRLRIVRPVSAPLSKWFLTNDPLARPRNYANNSLYTIKFSSEYILLKFKQDFDL